MGYGGIIGQKTIVDAFTKDETWKDATAALFGLGVDSVPDDGFAYLGKYAQHWWKRKNKDAYEPAKGDILDIGYRDAKDNYLTWQIRGDFYSALEVEYSDEVIASKDGVSLSGNINRVKLTMDSYLSEYAQVLLGKYVKPNAYEGATSSQKNTSIMYVLPDSRFNYTTVDGNFTYATSVQKMYQKKVPTDDISYVQSSNRSAYPDSGEQDGYEYEYLGIPFDNAVNSTKIETGSYTGTGTYGQSNPNTLTFGFEPKMIVIYANVNGVSVYISAIILTATPYFSKVGSGNSSEANKLTISNNGKTVSWFNTDSSTYQLNSSSSVYEYVAIG